MSKFPVVRDLVVDRSRIFARLEKVKAWVPVDSYYDLGPGPRQSQEEQELAYQYSKCMSLRLLPGGLSAVSEDRAPAPQAARPRSSLACGFARPICAFHRGPCDRPGRVVQHEPHRRDERAASGSTP